MKRKSNNEGSIRQRKDGRWEVRATGSIDYATGKPKRISRYAKTKAVNLLHELEYQIHHMRQIDPTSTTLADWLRYWLETYKMHNLKQSTYVSYRGYIEKHVAIAFPTMKLKDLTARELQEFYNFKISDGLSPKTILNIHRCLHEALKQAVLEQYIPFNPSDAVALPKREKPEIEILNREEQTRLIQASYSHRYGVFIRLTLTTGLRLGEVLGLSWDNIDLRSNTLFVRQTLGRLEKIDWNGIGAKTEIVMQVPKTKNSIRSIPLLPFIVKELQEWRNVQLSDKAIAGAAYQDTGLVVTNPFGGCIEPRTFKDYYNQILDMSGIGHFTFHALRHTFCTRALENDMDAKTVSAIMGHYSVAFTLDTYGHVLDSHKREEIMKMENIFSTPVQPQAYPVVVTPTMNGFILNAVDFDELSLEADNITNGLTQLHTEITERLIGCIPPMATPCQDLILNKNKGEFVAMLPL